MPRPRGKKPKRRVRRGPSKPAWIGAPHPRDPDRYYVEFWRPEWQAILFGTPTSYIYGTFAQGYDGVLLGGLDSLRFAEGGMEAVSTRR